MTLTAYLITLRGRIREALVPELQYLRDRLAREKELNDQLSVRALPAETNTRYWMTIAVAQLSDARRGRFLLDKMRHQQCGPNEGWTLDELFPGDDPASAVDAAMAKETKNAD
jgi:hypothetical protein